MPYPIPQRLSLPVGPYVVSDEHWKFGDRVPRRFGLWARHLGDDVVVPAGTVVSAIGEGEVVLAETLPGSERRRSWGGVVVIKHKIQNPKSKIDVFYSLYGHLINLAVAKGDVVAGGQKLGEVASGYTPENGWWKIPHLHFAIYTGRWRGVVLPGYWRPERFWQTRRSWWHEPERYIEEYNARNHTEEHESGD